MGEHLERDNERIKVLIKKKKKHNKQTKRSPLIFLLWKYVLSKSECDENRFDAIAKCRSKIWTLMKVFLVKLP